MQRPTWRNVLLDWPARIFDAWLLVYRLVVVGMILATMIGVTAMLLLWAVGIRWGW